MNEPGSLPTQQIGKLGELLVQYQLLRFGVESANLTTDSGIDLVAYSPKKKEALTIQVKANLKPKPGGGKGHPSIDWWVPDNSPADLFAFVDISEARIWLVTNKELPGVAQQHSSGRRHFYLNVCPETDLKGKKGLLAHVSKFETYQLKNRIQELFFG